MTTIKTTIQYIEDNLLTVTGPDEVADYTHVSVVYLQRGFQVMTGYTIGEYIRNRRLFLCLNFLESINVSLTRSIKPKKYKAT